MFCETRIKKSDNNFTNNRNPLLNFPKIFLKTADSMNSMNSKSAKSAIDCLVLSSSFSSNKLEFIDRVIHRVNIRCKQKLIERRLR